MYHMYACTIYMHMVTWHGRRIPILSTSLATSAGEGGENAENRVCSQ